ncbi:AMP-binding protein [Actinocorallia sp. B10E7]|uniref:AMP-binding protein n=1 Tax=Actinocorallia sp. B10E7 TaxID=3153558 RepID=UPI00325F8556
MDPRRTVDLAHALRSFSRAGLLDLRRPDQPALLRWELRRWGAQAASVRAAARRHGDGIALVDDLGELSFTELDRRSDALCLAWRGLGLDERSVVAVLCRDHRWLLDSLFAAAKLGATALLLNTGSAGPQLADIARGEGVTAIVHDEEFAEAVGHLPREIPRFTAWTDEPPPGGLGVAPRIDLAALIRRAPSGRPRPPGRAGAIVLLTSGTTGPPKGAPRRVRSLDAVAQLLDRVPWRAREATLVASPLFHGTGLAHALLAISLGSTLVLQRRFDAARTVRLAAEHRCTALVLVPTMLHRILALGPVDDADLSRLRIVLSAGSALSPDLVVRALDRFGDVLYNLYGSTEVATATVARPHELRRAPGTAGRCPRGCRIRLYDEDDRPIDRPNVQGRIFVTNGTRFDGYTGGGSRQVLDGLMSTGDVGHFDEDGLLFVDGRDDDMIVSGGENVFPGEIEDLLSSHPGIEEAVVVPVPDAEFGRRLKAFVVPAPGSRLTPEEVREYVRGSLARHKVPRDVVLVDDLPRTPTGKVLRRALT